MIDLFSRCADDDDDFVDGEPEIGLHWHGCAHCAGKQNGQEENNGRCAGQKGKKCVTSSVYKATNFAGSPGIQYTHREDLPF